MITAGKKEDRKKDDPTEDSIENEDEVTKMEEMAIDSVEPEGRIKNNLE